MRSTVFLQETKVSRPVSNGGTTDERELVRPFLVDAQSFCIRTRHICIFSLSVVTDHDSSGLFTIQLNSYILTMFGYSS